MALQTSIGIIGFGRFGRLLASLLKPAAGQILVHDLRDISSEADARGLIPAGLEQVMQAGTVFLAVPIRTFPVVLGQIARLARPGQLLVDVASVKTRIRDWMLAALPEGVEILNTHPMFGPDSMGQDADLKLVYCPTRISPEHDEHWRRVFSSWGCRLVELSPEDHDRLAARSQGLTHVIGRVMQTMGIQQTAVDTLGFRQVHHVVEQTCQDSEELFRDLQNYNPNTPDMLRELREALDKVEGTLFRRPRQELRVGYQGVAGSFSEQAALRFCGENDIRAQDLTPCVSSAGVLDALNRYRIDIGIMAMENARGGVVHESIHALAAGRCRIAAMFHLQVRQCLLVREDEADQPPRVIQSHLQALKQCDAYLDRNYQGLPRIEAEDTALAARLLSEGELAPGTAVIAPARAAELYGLRLLARDIQDLEDNQTLFLALVRPGSGIQLHNALPDVEVSGP